MYKASPSILLYNVSVLVKLLLANSIGCSVKLFGALCFRNYILSLICRRPAPRPTPMHLFLDTVVPSHFKKATDPSFLMTDFALSYRLWYVLLHVHSLFVDEHFLCGSQNLCC